MRSGLTAALASTLLCVLVLAAPAHAAFPGNNGKIAFGVRGLTESTYGCVHLVNPDGTGRVPFQEQCPRSDPPWLRSSNQPSWSPDGSKLAYEGLSGINFANADGTGETEVYYAESSTGLAWSPDGGQLAGSYFTCTHEECESALFTVKAEGGDPYPNHSFFALLFDSVCPCEPGPAIYGAPAWSPDGTEIAFVQQGTTPSGIYIIKPDGTGLTPLATGAAAPSWSPDGQKIAFTRGGDIGVMNADGSGQANVTNGPGRNVAPAWSPDGAKIAFASDRADPNLATCTYSCDFDIYVMNADGSEETRLTSDPSVELDPDWQPIPGPKRSDYKNAAQFCKAERDFLGEEAFSERYGTNRNGANAYGKCVSS